MPANAVRILRQIAGDDQTDAELLGRFVDRRDGVAFEALTRRHAPMVWGVCRRVLPTDQDAEDAFQASFLVLVRKARAVPRDAVGNWLYGVARRAALLARRTIARRRETVGVTPDCPAPEPRPPSALRAALDEELGRLPEIYRTVVVLCDLEGRTRREAAASLGWPEGTVAGRLSRARELLAKRLARHAPAMSVAAVLSGSASARVPAVLAPSAAIPPGVAALAGEVLGVMAGGKLMKAAAVVLLVGCAGFGMVLRAGQTTPVAPAGTPSAAVAAPPAAEVKAAKPASTDLADLQGEWVVVAMEGSGKQVSADEVRGMRWTFKGNEITGSQPRGGGKASFRLNPGTTPKEIDITRRDGNRPGTTAPGIYTIDGPKLRLCYGEKARPTAFATAPGDERTMLTLEKEAFTAWGKEAGGLQAGLEVKGRKTYRLGETLTLTVRVRNVGKEAVKFEYIRQYLDEHPPGVTGADGKAIPQATGGVLGVAHVPVEVRLEPGKDLVLGTRIHGTAGVPYDLRPAVGGGPPASQHHPLRVGTGKVALRYERVFGNSSIGSVKLDPAVAGLATGRLEIEVTDAGEKGSLYVPTYDGMRELKGKEAAAYQTTNDWLAERLREANSVKVGSTYAEVARHFRTDGGLTTVGHSRMVMNLCPYIKIDVEFERVRDAVPPTSRVIRVSRPYFEPEYLD